MKINESKLTTKNLARITGVFYLLIIFCGLYSGMAVRGSLIDFADPTGTIQNIAQNESLYRIGFLSDLVMVISDVIVSLLFFLLLKRVNMIVAIFATVFRLIQSAILGANLINLFSPILRIQGFADLSAAQQESVASSVLQELQIFEYGYLISGVFFSINCLLMGYLLYRSEIIPKVWGVSLSIAGVAYLLNCIVNFVDPALAQFTQLLVLVSAVFAELGLCLYLLIKGTRSNPKLALATS